MLDKLTQEYFVAILRHGVTGTEVTRVVLARGTASLPELRGRAAIQPLGSNPRALSRVWDPFGTRRGGLPGRRVHVQHRGRGADLCGNLSRCARLYLANTAVGRVAVRRRGYRDCRTIRVLPIFQDAL